MSSRGGRAKRASGGTATTKPATKAPSAAAEQRQASAERRYAAALNTSMDASSAAYRAEILENPAEARTHEDEAMAAARQAQNLVGQSPNIRPAFVSMTQAQRDAYRSGPYAKLDAGSPWRARVTASELARYKRGDLNAPTARPTPARETAAHAVQRTAEDLFRMNNWLRYGPGYLASAGERTRAQDQRDALYGAFRTALRRDGASPARASRAKQSA